MNDLNEARLDYAGFVVQAKAFKTQLQEAHCFTPDEIAAMLGTFVVAGVQQFIQQQMPPEFFEMLTKQNRLSDIPPRHPMRGLKRHHPDPLDHIEAVRRDNNVAWMDILRLALDARPKEAKAILKRIEANDSKVRDAMRELAND